MGVSATTVKVTATGDDVGVNAEAETKPGTAGEGTSASAHRGFRERLADKFHVKKR